MDSWLTLPAIALSILILLASFLFLLLRPSKSSGPVIFLIGPSGSGKTSLFSYLKYGKVLPTQTSMTINSSSLTHPSLEKQITLLDCPGHPRLAHLLRQSLTEYSPKGFLLFLDSANLKQNLNEVANTVYSTLLLLPRPCHILIIVNKSDLFTALPVAQVRKLLESAISGLKKTRDEASLVDEAEERSTLGGVPFDFDELEEEGVVVEWTRGSVEVREIAGVLEWISKRIS